MPIAQGLSNVSMMWSPSQRQRIPAPVLPPSSGSQSVWFWLWAAACRAPPRAQLNICLPLLWVVYSILMLSSVTFYFKGPCDTPMHWKCSLLLVYAFHLRSFIVWDIPWACAPLMQDHIQEHPAQPVTNWDALLFLLFSMGRNVWAKPNISFFDLK